MPVVPTAAEVQTMMKDSAAVFRSTYEYGNLASPNFRAKEDAQFNSLKGEWGGAIYNPTIAASRDLSRGIAQARQAVLAWVLSYAQVLDYAGNNPLELWQRIYRKLQQDGDSVDSRELTYGPVTAVGGPVGDGIFYRLTTDKYTEDIEAVTVETKTFICSSDRYNGARRHEEVFDVFGEPAELMGTLQDGSGLVGRITGLSELTSLQHLENPGFDSDAVNAAPAVITGWEVNGSIANYEISTAQTYRVPEGVADSESKALRQTDADKITQLFTRPLNPFSPWLAAVHVFPISADGNFVLRVGSHSVTLALTALSGWKRIVLAQDENLWYDNFRETTLDIELEWTGTTGEVFIDTVIFGPMQPMDGSFWAPIGGQVEFARDDEFTVVDTEANPSAINQWWLRQAGLYLPGNKVGAETITDPVL